MKREIVRAETPRKFTGNMPKIPPKARMLPPRGSSEDTIRVREDVLKLEKKFAELALKVSETESGSLRDVKYLTEMVQGIKDSVSAIQDVMAKLSKRVDAIEIASSGIEIDHSVSDELDDDDFEIDESAIENSLEKQDGASKLKAKAQEKAKGKAGK